MKIIFFLVIFLGLLQGEILNTKIAPVENATQFEGITLLDQKILLFKKIGGLKFSEISDVAYDLEKKRLYLVSDEGKLFVFNASFSNKIETLNALSGVPLVKKDGQTFRKWRRDSEGLALDNKGQLYVSFEGRAKIGRFDQKGRMVKQYTLPKKIGRAHV